MSEIKTFQYYINLRIDKLESNLKDDLAELKEMMASHLHHCDNQMEHVNVRVRDLEAFKNKVIGIVIVATALIGIVKVTW